MSASASKVAPRTRRHQLLWELHDFGQGRGLEIGPLHNATVGAHDADVRYADITDRASLVAKYEADPSVDTDLIPEIHFPLTDELGSVRSLRESAAPGGPYDWVMASHVIEHVPDFIGWLADVADLTKDGGRLVLAVPDRRYCFDVHRPPTTVGQLLQAHELGETRPSIRAVYDHFRAGVFADVTELWQGHPPGYSARRRSLETVIAMLERARAGEYLDCHVWTFTPDSLLEQVTELRDLGKSVWVTERIQTTRPDTLEFYVVLRRSYRDGQGLAEMVAAEPRPSSKDMPDWLQDLVVARGQAKQAAATAPTPVASGTAHASGDAARAETKLIGLDDVDISEYDFLDFGAGTGGSLRRCAKMFGGRGLGIEINERKIAEAQAAGEPVVVGDILRLPRRKLVRYVCMDNFLEHLPDFDAARRMIEMAAAVASDFIYIAHPSFEDEAYLRAIGFKQYWQDWTGHPSHLLVSDLTAMLNKAGARSINIDFGDSTRSTEHPWILPIDAPRDQHRYDAVAHGPKPTVTLAKPVYREIRITAHLSPGSAGCSTRITD